MVFAKQTRGNETRRSGSTAFRGGRRTRHREAEFDSFAIFPCKPEPVTQPHYVEGETAAPWDL